MINVAGVCRRTRGDMFQTLQRHVTFTHRCAATLKVSIQRIPRTILRRIGILHLNNGGHFDFNIETRFAEAFDLLCRHMPNLIRFQLKSRYDSYHIFWTSHEERRRPLLRFGAFLISKHRNMDLLIWPGDSGPTFEPGRDEVTAYVDVASSKHLGRKQLYREPCPRYLSKADAEVDLLGLVEDRLLHSTILRRLKWDDMWALTVEDLTIDRNVHATSEIDEGYMFFRQVDREGYMTRGRRTRLGKQFIPVDKLIEICDKRMRKAIANGSYKP